MLTTGIFTSHIYPIKTKLNKPFHLVFLGDIHYGSYQFAEDEFESFLLKVADLPSPYIIGMGDYVDLGSTSERKILGTAALHESTASTLDQLNKTTTAELCDIIREFTDAPFIGLVEGNHYGDLKSGGTTTNFMAERLGTKYLGVCSLIRCPIRADSVRSAIDIFVHHGKGAGQTPGGSMNALKKMCNIALADIYAMGHDHQRYALGDTCFYLDQGGILKERRRLYIRTGSFLRGYKDGEASYIVDNAYNPVEMGGIIIECTLRRTKGRGLWVERKAIL